MSERMAADLAGKHMVAGSLRTRVLVLVASDMMAVVDMMAVLGLKGN